MNDIDIVLFLFLGFIIVFALVFLMFQRYMAKIGERLDRMHEKYLKAFLRMERWERELEKVVELANQLDEDTDTLEDFIFTVAKKQREVSQRLERKDII